nr:MAG TPA: hypothetical protein [Caudoviricetes sp.]
MPFYCTIAVSSSSIIHYVIIIPNFTKSTICIIDFIRIVKYNIIIGSEGHE